MDGKRDGRAGEVRIGSCRGPVQRGERRALIWALVAPDRHRPAGHPCYRSRGAGRAGELGEVGGLYGCLHFGWNKILLLP